MVYNDWKWMIGQWFFNALWFFQVDLIVILTKEEARADVVEDEKVFELVSDGQLSIYIHPCFIIAIFIFPHVLYLPFLYFPMFYICPGAGQLHQSDPHRCWRACHSSPSCCYFLARPQIQVTTGWLRITPLAQKEKAGTSFWQWRSRREKSQQWLWSLARSRPQVLLECLWMLCRKTIQARTHCCGRG